MRVIVVDSKILAYVISATPSRSLIEVFEKLAELKEELSADQVIMCWDIGKSDIRLAMWPQYKQGRSYSEKAEDFDYNYEVLLPKLSAMLGIHNVGVKGCEADDLMSILASSFRGEHLTIVTADQDLLQCTIGRDNIHWYDPRKHVYGTTPYSTVNEFLVAKTLLGDAGDNLLGISLIGPETFNGWLPSHKDPTKEEVIALCKSNAKFKVHKKYVDAGVVDNLKDFDKAYELNMALGRTMTDTSLLTEEQRVQYKECYKALRLPTETSSIEDITTLCEQISGHRVNVFGGALVLSDHLIEEIQGW